MKKNYDNRKIRIICTDIIDQPIIRHKADGFYIVPKGNSKNYLSEIIKICKKEKIKIIIPVNGSEIITISKNLEFFEKNGIVSTISTYEVIKKVMNKYHTYEKLQNVISVPKFFHVKNFNQFKVAIKKLNYPTNDICFKPSKYEKSGGSRGFRILRKKNSLRKIILEKKPGSVEIDFFSVKKFFEGNKSEILVMEYLPGEEYSVYAIADKGRMNYCVINKRVKLKEQYSWEAEIIEDDSIYEICKKIIQEMKLDYNVNIQLKKSKNGEIKLIEINPRVAGTIILPAIGGINLPYLAVKQALGESISKHFKINKVKMIRYWDELFLINDIPYEIKKF